MLPDASLSRDMPWSIREYLPESSSTAGPNLGDQTPSLSTDDEELDGRISCSQGSHSRAPISNMIEVAPSIFNRVPGAMEYNPMLRLMSTMTTSSGSTNIVGSGPVTCLECPPTKTFGRPYDLNRHITEQHRCRHEACSGVKFSNRKEKKEHEKEHSKDGLGYRCGTCALSGTSLRPLSRKEKLTKHLKEFHNISNDLDFFKLQCTRKPCYQGESCGGIYFTSQHDLEKHVNHRHVLETSQDVSPNGGSCGDGNGAKRLYDQDAHSAAKRWNKGPHDFDMFIPQQSTIPSAACNPIDKQPHSVFDSISPILSDPKADYDTAACPLQKSIEVTQKLSVIDLWTLTKQRRWSSFITKLNSLHISPTFNCKTHTLRLHGSCSAAEMEQGRMLLADVINQVKSMGLRGDEIDVSPVSKPREGCHQHVSVHPQPEIYTLDPKEDANTLKLWNTRFLPKFPDIVQEALIEGSYSVALVRQNGPDGSQPIIRFRSSGNQGEMSRQIIQESVETICTQNHHQLLHVQFTEGTIVRLVGGSSTASFFNDPSNDDKFPHARRPWARPGMGASIGLSRCPHVSATLGGYISVDDRTYMLTVDHFISACCCVTDTQLRSPSISDVADVKDQLKKKFQQLGLKISRSALNEVPLEQVKEKLFALDIDEELEHYRRFENELDDGDNGFALGKIRYRCGGSMAPLRPSVNPDLAGLSHHMDWSVSEVTAEHREGKNVHRYGRVASPSLDDFEKEVMRPEGCGMPCETIGEATGGESVYYVGTTSGLREGIINPALIQYKDECGISHERSLVVPRCETLRDSDFQGDSGAWIISNDNKLLGLLWGWDNGSLLYTPIQDIFADITQKMKCRQIKLPKYTSSPRFDRSRSLLSRTNFYSKVTNEPDLIDLDSSMEENFSLLHPLDLNFSMDPSHSDLHGLIGTKTENQPEGVDYPFDMDIIEDESSVGYFEDYSTPQLASDHDLPFTDSFSTITGFNGLRRNARNASSTGYFEDYSIPELASAHDLPFTDSFSTITGSNGLHHNDPMLSEPWLSDTWPDPPDLKSWCDHFLNESNDFSL